MRINRLRLAAIVLAVAVIGMAISGVVRRQNPEYLATGDVGVLFLGRPLDSTSHKVFTASGYAAVVAGNPALAFSPADSTAERRAKISRINALVFAPSARELADRAPTPAPLADAAAQAAATLQADRAYEDVDSARQQARADSAQFFAVKTGSVTRTMNAQLMVQVVNNPELNLDLRKDAIVLGQYYKRTATANPVAMVFAEDDQFLGVALDVFYNPPVRTMVASITPLVYAGGPLQGQVNHSRNSRNELVVLCRLTSNLDTLYGFVPAQALRGLGFAISADFAGQ